jgi:Raf kinase inhibitor-like YbhB/YbcL family protein
VAYLLALLLFSTTFVNGGTIPQAMVATACGGQNISPQLSWSHVPPGTRSFALIVRDEDAAAPGGFFHWAVYNIPASRLAVPRGAGFGTPFEARNDRGTIGYFGPCPPPGKPHRYQFTLYALDVRSLATGAPLTARDVRALVRQHVLAQATLVGLWRR